MSFSSLTPSPLTRWQRVAERHPFRRADVAEQDTFARQMDRLTRQARQPGGLSHGWETPLLQTLNSTVSRNRFSFVIVDEPTLSTAVGCAGEVLQIFLLRKADDRPAGGLEEIFPPGTLDGMDVATALEGVYAVPGPITHVLLDLLDSGLEWDLAWQERMLWVGRDRVTAAVEAAIAPLAAALVLETAVRSAPAKRATRL